MFTNYLWIIRYKGHKGKEKLQITKLLLFVFNW